MKTKEKLYMNPKTGSVDTLENWKIDTIEFCKAHDMDLSMIDVELAQLVEVVKDEAGDWIEA